MHAHLKSELLKLLLRTFNYLSLAMQENCVTTVGRGFIVYMFVLHTLSMFCSQSPLFCVFSDEKILNTTAMISLLLSYTSRHKDKGIVFQSDLCISWRAYPVSSWQSDKKAVSRPSETSPSVRRWVNGLSYGSASILEWAPSVISHKYPKWKITWSIGFIPLEL